MSTEPEAGSGGGPGAGPPAEEPGARKVEAVAAGRLGVPIAAALAVGGQFCLAAKTAGPPGIAAGLILYLAAVAALLPALLRERREGVSTPPPAPPAEPGVEWGLAAAIIFTGLFLRLHAIDVIPPGLNNDEALNAIEAGEILAGKPFSTITERGMNRETMFHCLAALSYRYPAVSLNPVRAAPALFGLQPTLIHDRLIDRVLPLRAVSIAAGVLTLAALYLFARRRFGWQVAALATLFLAFSPWHLLYSRAGLRAILAPLFAVAATALFLRARDSGRLRDHLLWGGIVGLGLWSYTSFRAVPLAIAAFVLTARPGGRAGRSAGWMRPLLYGGGAAAVLGGLIWLRSGLTLGDFLFRGAYATLPSGASWGARLAHLLHTATMVNYFPSRYAVIESEEFISDGVSTTFGSIGLEPEAIVTAALAALGLIHAAWRGLRKDGEPSVALPVLVVLTVLLTIGWTGPSLTRMLIVVPWLCLFAALLAWRIRADLASLGRRWAAWLGAAAVAGIALLACAQGYSNYFLQAGRSRHAMENFGPVQTLMGMYVGTLPEDQSVVVLHTRMVDSLTFLIGDRPNVQLIADPSSVDLDAIARRPGTISFVIEHTRRFAEPMKFLVNRFQLLQSTASFADGRFSDPVCVASGPDAAASLGEPCAGDADCGAGGSCQERTVFWRSTLWKDASGRPVPPPGVMPDAPPGMSFPAPPGTPPPGS
jgi:hypothetical protein